MSNCISLSLSLSLSIYLSCARLFLYLLARDYIKGARHCNRLKSQRFWRFFFKKLYTTNIPEMWAMIHWHKSEIKNHLTKFSDPSPTPAQPLEIGCIKKILKVVYSFGPKRYMWNQKMRSIPT